MEDRKLQLDDRSNQWTCSNCSWTMPDSAKAPDIYNQFPAHWCGKTGLSVDRHVKSGQNDALVLAQGR